MTRTQKTLSMSEAFLNLFMPVVIISAVSIPNSLCKLDQVGDSLLATEK